jgi:hypothetical protein
MPNIVQFLETLGTSPNLQSGASFVHAVESAGLDAASCEALLARDADAISRLLGGRAAMRCLVATPD